MIKKIISILAASSIAVSAAPFAALADEADIVNTIISAEDESFEAAVEALGEVEEPVIEEEEDITIEEIEELESEDPITEEYFDTEAELYSDEVSMQNAQFNDMYDIVKIDNDFNDEVNIGAPDKSNYKISDGTDIIWDSASIDLSSNYYLSLDFKLMGNTTDNQIIMTNSKGDVGPQLSVSGSNLRNQIKSNGFDELYDNFDVNKWYKLELEGRMMVVGSVTIFTLYEYDENGQATQVAQKSIVLRNFSETAKKTYGYTVLAEGVCYDNEYAVQEYPDSVLITEDNNLSEVTGGDSLQFTAVAQRNGVSENITQPAIEWSISGVIEGEEDYIKIDDGRLIVNAQASEQEIVVTATAQSNGNPYGEYPVTIHKRNLDHEKFDTITLIGANSIDAGSSESYSFTAMKNGIDVTETLTAEDVVWNIMDSTGARLLGNKYITVDNGTVTVSNGVIGQDIRVRAATEDGYVYGEIDVTINNNSSETIVQYDACEKKVEENKALVYQGSWDGSSYYVKNTTDDFLTSGTLGDTTTSGDILISMDLKFMSETGSGVTTVRRDGGTGLWLCSHNGLLAVQTGNSSYKDLSVDGNTYSLDANSWYHIDIMFNTQNPSMNIWKYDDNGEMIDKATFTSEDNFVFRSTQGFNRMKLNSNTGLDNYRVVYPDPTELEIIGDTTTIGAGSSIELGISGKRDGLVMPGIAMSSVSWAVYDGDGDDALPIEGDDITVTAGVLSSKGLTSPQTVYVRAISVKDKSIYASIPITITEANQFEITNVGVDAENDRQLVRIYANKLTDYNEDVVFIMTFYDQENKLIGSYSKKANAKNLKAGENEIAIDYTLPENYDKNTGSAKIMAWTALTTKEEPEGVSGEFRASYDNGSIILSNVPDITGKMTIAVYSPGVSNGDLSGDTSSKIVYASQSAGGLTSISVPNLEASEYTVAIGGFEVNGVYSVCRAVFKVE